MRVGIIQSCYIPWRGYFDFIASVDVFVIHDDIQYTKGDWRNRNRIKTANGKVWLTVPVHYRTVNQLICDTLINDQVPWASKHIRLMQEHYRNAPYAKDAINLLANTLEKIRYPITISELNIAITQQICTYFGIGTPLLKSSELEPIGSKTERLLSMLKKLNATTYLSGPSADDYLDKERFSEAGISLEYKSYDYKPYPQLWGEFDGAVSVLDLIANCGEEAKSLLQSKHPNIVVVP